MSVNEIKCLFTPGKYSFLPVSHNVDASIQKQTNDTIQNKTNKTCYIQRIPQREKMCLEDKGVDKHR